MIRHLEMAGGGSLFRTAIHDIQIVQNNRILVAGECQSYDVREEPGAYVMAYTMDGQLDSTFGDNGKFRHNLGYYQWFYRMILQDDGKILVAGCTLLKDNPGFTTLIRLLPDGTPDNSFGTNGFVTETLTYSGETYGIAIQQDGKILTTGYDNETNKGYAFRYLSNGDRDPSFGVNGQVALPMIAEGTDIITFPSGKILIYGWLGDSNLPTVFVQLLPDGTLDPYFGYGGTYFSPSLKISPPLKMKLIDGNRIITTGTVHQYQTNFVSIFIVLQSFLLDLNVGVISPKDKLEAWIYPNPIQDKFEVGLTLETPEVLSFDLYDMQGRLLKTLKESCEFGSGTYSMPLELGVDLPAGNYVLQVVVRGKSAVAVQVVKG